MIMLHILVVDLTVYPIIFAESHSLKKVHKEWYQKSQRDFIKVKIVRSTVVLFCLN